MASSSNFFGQFNQNPENQEIINLQNNLASYGRRLDELQKLAANPDVAAKMASLQTDINALQRQIDNVANSGKKEVKALVETFNSLKASVAESRDILSQKIIDLYRDLQANTDDDKRTKCFMHLDEHRWQLAAAAADQMTTDAVKQFIKDYCSETKHRQDVKQTLSEFINCMKDRTRRDLYKHLLNMFNAKFKQEGITKAGGNDKGKQLNQLNHPEGIFIDDDQTIYIADWRNHRIVEWKCNATSGRIVAGGNGKGNQTNQLNQLTDVIIDKENNSLIISDHGNRRVMRWSLQNNTTNGQIIIEDIDCYGLTMDKDGSLYVSDIEKGEVRRWKRGDQKGTIVAGGNGKGNHLNQLSRPSFIFVDEDYSLYVSDEWNNQVRKWVKDAEEGIVVAGGNETLTSLAQLSSPQGVIVNQFGQIYVADRGNHRVMRWCKGAKEGTIVVGGNGWGQQSNQLYSPTGLSFDRQGNLYVADWENYRIQKFEIN